MMHLKFDEIQEMIQDSARRFFAAEFTPEKVREIEESSVEYPAELWDQITELGWSGLALPESIGGGGLGKLELCILAEEAGRAAASTPLLVSSGLAASCLQALPDSPQAANILHRISTTNLIVTAALADSGTRSEQNLSSLVLKATFGSFTLTGKKYLVPFAPNAGVILVSVSTPVGEPAIVAIETDRHELKFTRHNSPLSGTPLYEVEFDGVVIPEHCVLARGETAATALESALEIATLLSMAEAVGLCEGIVHLTSEYVKVREQFGVALGTFQAVSHTLAEMRINIDVIRLLAQQAAWLWDQGRSATFEIASAKVFASDIVAKIALDGHRFHGAIGYSSEYDLQLYSRRAKAFSVTWGDKESQIERGSKALGISRVE